jgi:hypothetical protein
LDAESTDLTARIQARRRALVLDGSVEPLRPGERVIHGRQPGAHDSFEVAGGAQVRAAEMRVRRARVSEEVVDMDYTDYREAADADESFEVGGQHDPEPKPDDWVPDDDDVAHVEQTFEYAERLVATEDPVLELRLAGIEAALTQLDGDLDERFDTLGAGFLALAKGISEELVAIRRAVEGCEPTTAEPEPVIEKKRPWWRCLFGPASGPYE